MKIKVITAFNDQQAKEGDDPFVAAGTERTVSEERGEHLVRLGLATKVRVKEAAAKKAPRRKAPANRAGSAPIAPPVAATPPRPDPDLAKPAGQ